MLNSPVREYARGHENVNNEYLRQDYTRKRKHGNECQDGIHRGIVSERGLITYARGVLEEKYDKPPPRDFETAVICFLLFPNLSDGMWRLT